MDELHNVYDRFCSFGSGSIQNLSATSQPQQMDGAKFAKFSRDCKIIGQGKVTMTDVDIIFNKIKKKNERKISFEQFVQGVERLAELAFPQCKDSYEAFRLLTEKIVRQPGPLTHNVTVRESWVFWFI